MMPVSTKLFAHVSPPGSSYVELCSTCVTGKFTELKFHLFDGKLYMRLSFHRSSILERCSLGEVSKVLTELKTLIKEFMVIQLRLSADVGHQNRPHTGTETPKQNQRRSTGRRARNSHYSSLQESAR